jgi:hypothetical protein
MRILWQLVIPGLVLLLGGGLLLLNPFFSGRPIPDRYPIVGHADEFVASLLVIWALGRLYGALRQLMRGLVALFQPRPAPPERQVDNLPCIDIQAEVVERPAGSGHLPVASGARPGAPRPS